MKNWSRRLIGVLGIAGGITAVAVIGAQALAVPGLLMKLVMMLYIFVALWGIYVGILLIERDQRADRQNFYFWLCQVPIVFLPGIGHKLGIGAFFFLWLEFPIRANFFVGLGANLQFRLFRIEPPVAIGVNIVALALAIWFWRQIAAVKAEPLPGGVAEVGMPDAAEQAESVGAASHA
ncbi:hypothetical protein [Chitinimonas naiadis]